MTTVLKHILRSLLSVVEKKKQATGLVVLEINNQQLKVVIVSIFSQVLCCCKPCCCLVWRFPSLIWLLQGCVHAFSDQLVSTVSLFSAHTTATSFQTVLTEGWRISGWSRSLTIWCCANAPSHNQWPIWWFGCSQGVGCVPIWWLGVPAVWSWWICFWLCHVINWNKLLGELFWLVIRGLFNLLWCYH